MVCGLGTFVMLGSTGILCDAKRLYARALVASCCGDVETRSRGIGPRKTLMILHEVELYGSKMLYE